jgi:hypothetical protein
MSTAQLAGTGGRWGAASPWGAYGRGGAVLSTVGAGLQNIDWQQTGEALSQAGAAGVSIYSNISAIKAQQAAEQAAANQLALQASAPAPVVSIPTGSGVLPWVVAGVAGLGALVLLLRGRGKGGRRKNPYGVEPVTIITGLATGISALVGAAKVGYDIRSGKRAERMSQTMAAHQQLQAAQTAAYTAGAQQAGAELQRAQQARSLKTFGALAVVGVLVYLFYKKRSSK